MRLFRRKKEHQCTPEEAREILAQEDVAGFWMLAEFPLECSLSLYPDEGPKIVVTLSLNDDMTYEVLPSVGTSRDF